MWDVTFILSKTSCQYKNPNDTSIPINTSFNPLPLRPPRKSSSNLLKQAEKYRLQIPPVLKFWTIQSHYMTKELTNLSTYHLQPTLHKDNQAIRQMRQQFQKNKYHLAEVNPPFNFNVSTSRTKTFLKLRDKHFLNLLSRCQALSFPTKWFFDFVVSVVTNYVDCHRPNLIYLTACNKCHMQYVDISIKVTGKLLFAMSKY